MSNEYAVRHDLICRTNYSWDDVGRALSWKDFHAFLVMLPVDSALYRNTHPESWTWDSGAATSHILAHVADEVRMLNYMYSKTHGGDPDDYVRLDRPFIHEEPRKKFDVDAFRSRLRSRYEQEE